MLKGQRKGTLDRILQVVMTENRHQHHFRHLPAPGLQGAHSAFHQVNMPLMNRVCGSSEDQQDGSFVNFHA